jgi:hypothetical protein
LWSDGTQSRSAGAYAGPAIVGSIFKAGHSAGVVVTLTWRAYRTNSDITR